MASDRRVVARALEALASDSDSDDSTTTNQLLAEERDIRHRLRMNEIHSTALSIVQRLESVPSSRHCNENNDNAGESFLEDMARREYEVQLKTRPSRADNENDRKITRIHQYHRLFAKLNLGVEATNFSGGGGGGDSDSDSSGSSSSGDDDNAHVNDPIAIAALNALADADDSDEGDIDEEDSDEENDDAQAHDETALRPNDITSVLHLLPSPSSIKFDSNSSEIRGTNNFQRLSNLLFSLANSEENPLIRADIPWPVIIACGSPFMDTSPFFGAAASPLSPPKPSLLQTIYHQSDDPHGTRLLKGVLRMDPPLEVVRVLVDAFPLSCLDMEAFFTACQFAHPRTSRRSEPSHALDHGVDTAFDIVDDVGEVVRLVMHETIRIRRLNNIDWGMVAFLGDARISPSHAKLLLLHFPEAVIDSNHGTFAVSPIDRMASGYFIHGERTAWVEKLRIALRVAAYVRLRREQIEQDPTLPKEITMPSFFFSSDCNVLRRRESGIIGGAAPNSAQTFYPYHELIRLIISPDFQGTRFGKDGFLRTIIACSESEPAAFLQFDNEGNLPIHIALQSTCESVLGVDGERRLFRYLLNLNLSSSLCLEGNTCGDGPRRLPLRMSIENGWPVFDLIIAAALACGSSVPSNANEYNVLVDKPLLHDALNGSYHPQFGIYLVREIVKHMLSKLLHHQFPTSQKHMRFLTAPVDKDGCTALHVALASKWPVYDLLAQAYPNHGLEVRDPSRFRFFPYQIAACDFAGSSRKVAPDGARTDSSIGADEQRQLIELSMLFEIVRECPHCVTCKPNELNYDDTADPGPTKKRSFSSIVD